MLVFGIFLDVKEDFKLTILKFSSVTTIKVVVLVYRIVALVALLETNCDLRASSSDIPSISSLDFPQRIEEEKIK